MPFEITQEVQRTQDSSECLNRYFFTDKTGKTKFFQWKSKVKIKKLIVGDYKHFKVQI